MPIAAPDLRHTMPMEVGAVGWDDRPKCFNCGKPGHAAAQCYAAGGGASGGAPAQKGGKSKGKGKGKTPAKGGGKPMFPRPAGAECSGKGGASGARPDVVCHY